MVLEIELSTKSWYAAASPGARRRQVWASTKVHRRRRLAAHERPPDPQGVILDVLLALQPSGCSMADMAEGENRLDARRHVVGQQRIVPVGAIEFSSALRMP